MNERAAEIPGQVDQSRRFFLRAAFTVSTIAAAEAALDSTLLGKTARGLLLPREARASDVDLRSVIYGEYIEKVIRENVPYVGWGRMPYWGAYNADAARNVGEVAYNHPTLSGLAVFRDILAALGELKPGEDPLYWESKVVADRLDQGHCDEVANAMIQYPEPVSYPGETFAGKRILPFQKKHLLVSYCMGDAEMPIPMESVVNSLDHGIPIALRFNEGGEIWWRVGSNRSGDAVTVTDFFSGDGYTTRYLSNLVEAYMPRHTLGEKLPAPNLVAQHQDRVNAILRDHKQRLFEILYPHIFQPSYWQTA